MDIDNITNPEEIELEIKRLEYKLKKKELNKCSFITSPLIIGIFTVAFSAFGSYVISNGQLKQSSENFNASLIENIMDDEVFVTKRKMEFLLTTGAIKENRSEIQNALSELCRKSANKYLQKGIQFSESGDDYSAIQEFDIATELDSLNHESYNRRAISNFNLGIELKSNEYYLNSIKDWKSANQLKMNYIYFLKIGETYAKLKKYEKSNEYCESAIKIKTKCFECYDLKAQNYKKIGDREKMCEAYEASQNIRPTYNTETEINVYCN